MPQPATKPPDQHLGEADQPVGDLGTLHQLAEQQEQRHRQDYEIVEPVEHALHDDLERHPRDQHQRARGRQSHADCNRQADCKQQQHAAEQDRR